MKEFYIQYWKETDIQICFVGMLCMYLSKVSTYKWLIPEYKNIKSSFILLHIYIKIFNSKSLLHLHSQGVIVWWVNIYSRQSISDSFSHSLTAETLTQETFNQIHHIVKDYCVLCSNICRLRLSCFTWLKVSKCLK